MSNANPSIANCMHGDAEIVISAYELLKPCPITTREEVKQSVRKIRVAGVVVNDLCCK